MRPEDRLILWEGLHGRARAYHKAAVSIAKPLEKRAAELADLGSDYARLVGVDENGRVRFTVRGFGQQTFTVKELEDG
jgi:hypothetical protein